MEPLDKRALHSMAKQNLALAQELLWRVENDQVEHLAAAVALTLDSVPHIGEFVADLLCEAQGTEEPVLPEGVYSEVQQGTIERNPGWLEEALEVSAYLQQKYNG